MANYESVMIFQGDLEEEKKEALLEKIKEVISKNGGELINLESWGKKKLAYTIKKVHQEGDYYLMNFQGEQQVISELEHLFKITEEVIRYLIINLEK